MAAGLSASQSRFEAWAREAGLGLEIRRFPEGTRTAEDAARAVGCSVGQIVKSLVFTLDGTPIVALVSGANRLDPARLPGLVERADAETARRATGYAIGGVPPFGHAEALRVFMDEDLENYDVVWAAGGRPDAVFPISPTRLRELSGAEVLPLSSR